MRNLYPAAVSAALIAWASTASAQDQTAAAPQPPVIAAPAAPATAPAAAPAPAATPALAFATAGTRVMIEVNELISTKTHKKGDWFNISLSSPLKLDGAVVIPAGVAGKGQVVDSGRSGIGGKPAKLVLAARYVEVEGQRIPLKALKMGVSGSDNTDTAMLVSTLPYVGVVGIFVKGGEIDITPGTMGWAKLATDFTPGAAPAAPSAPDAPAPAAPAAAPAASPSANQP